MVMSAGCTMMAIPHLADYARFYWEIIRLVMEFYLKGRRICRVLHIPRGKNNTIRQGSFDQKIFRDLSIWSLKPPSL
jgi:hypothetical protein